MFVGECNFISIHALREEGDDNCVMGYITIFTISIHALREEGDSRNSVGLLDGKGFLSTPSARRATWQQGRPRRGRSISIHALREEGDELTSIANGDYGISIHALREEGDRHQTVSCISHRLFLSTPSARRATLYPLNRPRYQTISIHALREEGDTWIDRFPLLKRNFYPRPPRGGRQRIP